ncbi:MAG: prepilin peptidase [Candidatus Nanohaloarchaea archaeon]
MSIVFSHILAFCVLFVGGIFDWKTTEVPDSVNLIGVIGGVLLHLHASLPRMDFSVLFSIDVLLSDPVSWFFALGEPLAWSLGVGIIFSIYGWSLYHLGMWGGADAFAMSVLGFAAPYSVSGVSLFYPVSLFTASLLLGFLYTVSFSLLYTYRNPEILANTWQRLKRKERRISIEVVLAGFISAIAALTSLRLALTYYSCFLLLIILTRFLREIQDHGMIRQVKVENLEGGEVLAREEESGGKVRGISEKEIKDFEKDTVLVRKGLKFVPVFPLALFLVDVAGFSVRWLFFLFS